MQGISAREFARRDGCSHTRVQRALASGDLTAFADGSLDPALVGSAWRATNRRKLRSDTGIPRPRLVHSVLATPATPAATDRATGNDAAPDDTPGGRAAAYADALYRKENHIAALRELEFLRKSGAVIALDLAERVLFDNFRAVRDAWLNWPMRIAPLLAADLDVPPDALTQRLTDYVHRHLAELGEPDASFTERED